MESAPSKAQAKDPLEAACAELLQASTPDTAHPLFGKYPVLDDVAEIVIEGDSVYAITKDSARHYLPGINSTHGAMLQRYLPKPKSELAAQSASLTQIP